MKLNTAEQLLVSNGARALVQGFYEAPLLRRLGGGGEGKHRIHFGDISLGAAKLVPLA